MVPTRQTAPDGIIGAVMEVTKWLADRSAMPLKPGNSGGGKGPQFKTDATSGEGFGDWATYQL